MNREGFKYKDTKKRLREDYIYDGEAIRPVKKVKAENYFLCPDLEIDLPTEIIFAIFDFVPYNELFKCMRVCKFWQECIFRKFEGWMLLKTTEYLALDEQLYETSYFDGNVCATSADDVWKIVQKISHEYDMYINGKNLADRVNAGKTVPQACEMFAELVSKNRSLYKSSLDPFNSQLAILPFDPIEREPISGLIERRQFHKYQLKAISWMRTVEERVPGIIYNALLPWCRSKSWIGLDAENSNFVPEARKHEFDRKFTFKGGVLADDIGLGKTAELIGLILSNKSPQLPEFDEKGLFNTRATLDAIIISASFLKNPRYFYIPNPGQASHVALSKVRLRSIAADNYLEAVKQTGNKKYCVEKPVLENFHFYRIIVDEAHEVFNDELITRIICELKKSYGWYVSATPNFNYALRDFLKLQYIAPRNHVAKWQDEKLILRNIVWRNTRVTVGEEFQVAKFTDLTLDVPLLPIEAFSNKCGTRGTEKKLELLERLYKSTSIDRSNFPKMNLDQYRQSCIDMIKALIKSCKQSISRYNTKIQELEQELEGFGDENSLDDERYDRYDSLVSRIEDSQYKLAGQTEDLPYYERTLEELQNMELVVPKKYNSLPNNDRGKIFRTMRDKYGSKITWLIFWINDRVKENTTNRIIIFAKQENEISMLSKTLVAYGVQFDRCCRVRSTLVDWDLYSLFGTSNELFRNAMVKSDAILKFKTNPSIRVITMSFDRTASGANLITANFIVFLDDNLHDDKELQAIGRAYRQGQDREVTLVRFNLLPPKNGPKKQVVVALGEPRPVLPSDHILIE